MKKLFIILILLLSVMFGKKVYAEHDTRDVCCMVQKVVENLSPEDRQVFINFINEHQDLDIMRDKARLTPWQWAAIGLGTADIVICFFTAVCCLYLRYKGIIFLKENHD